MAVAGSSVGLGNFLRFPGLAAQYGGGAFVVAYVISFLIVGMPLGWAEWTMGRFAGQAGYSSCPATFAFITRSRCAQLVGVIGVVIPVVVCMYYLVIESWCLGYAVDFLFDDVHLKAAGDAKALFADFIGDYENGAAMHWSWSRTLPWLAITLALNLWVIFRGLRSGIETVCKIGLPLLVGLGLIVLVRVYTLGTPDPAQPHNNVMNGLGYLWNTTKVQVVDSSNHVRDVIGTDAVAEAEVEVAASNGTLRLRTISVWMQLRNPRLWLAAAGQIFFSLAVGFGIIIVYASYLKKNDDVVLSGLTACSFSGFCEVVLGGLITVPAAVAFLGVAGVAGQAGIGLGFKVLPLVFSKMPLGGLVGAAFFFMLFLAALTTSISMLQPGVAFLQETTRAGRNACIGCLALITTIGSMFVLYYSADMKALDTLDFWGGTLLMFVLATLQTLIFSWVWGVDKGVYEMHRGAAITMPVVFDLILRWISPVFLVGIFILWVLQDILGCDFGAPIVPAGTGREVGRGAGGGDFISKAWSPNHYITDLIGPNYSFVARLSVAGIIGLGLVLAVMAMRSNTLRRARSGLPSAPEQPPDP